MPTIAERKPLSDKGNLPAPMSATKSELTPNTKAKLDENIKCQLAERVQRMNAAFQAERKKGAAPAPVAPAPGIEKVATMKFAVNDIPLREEANKERVAPAPAPAPVVTQKVVPPKEAEETKAKPVVAPIPDVPAKVVAPGITPPADPPAQPKPEEKKPVRLDGQDGLVRERLIPERRPRKKEEKKAKAGTIPPPRLSGDRPTRDEVPAEMRERKPTVPPLDMNKVKLVQQQERAALEREDARAVPPPKVMPPARPAPVAHDIYRNIPRNPLPAHDIPARHHHHGYIPPPSLAAAMPPVGLERGLHMPDRRVRDRHLPIHGLGRVGGGGLHAPSRPAFVAPPSLDDAALARLIARREYSW